MEPRVRSVNELAVRVAQDPDLATRIKENPVETLTDLAGPLQADVWIYRMVVGALGLAVLAGMVGAIVLAIADKATPEVLIALGSASVGALAGLLAPSPAGR